MAATGKRLAEGDLEGAREDYHSAVRIPFPADNLWCSQQMASLARSSVSPRREAALALAKEASTKAEQIGEVKFMGYYQSAVLASSPTITTRPKPSFWLRHMQRRDGIAPVRCSRSMPLPRNRQETNGRALEQTE